jgi:hypothetical protein
MRSSYNCGSDNCFIWAFLVGLAVSIDYTLLIKSSHPAPFIYPISAPFHPAMTLL